MDKATLLEARDLRVTFPLPNRGAEAFVRAARGISFSLSRGEILGIVGESGSGKSVTTSAIPALLPPHAIVSGSVLYEGRELLGLSVADMRAYRGKKIGMIFQEPGRSYDPLQTMGGAFFETLRNADPRVSRAEANRIASSLLQDVGLDDVERRLANYPHQFSGGQLQRIGIALALAQGCDLLIADEPTTALDVTIQAQIVALLKGIRDARGIAIVFISHNIDLVASVADRLLVMYGGLVMEEGPARAVLDSPAHPYTKALLAAAPRFGAHCSEGRLLSIPGRVPDPTSPEPGCPFEPRCPRAVPACAAAIPELVSLGAAEDRAQREGDGRGYRCILEPEAIV